MLIFPALEDAWMPLGIVEAVKAGA